MVRTSILLLLLANLAVPAAGWDLSGRDSAQVNVSRTVTNAMESTWGLGILNPIVADRRNINLPITGWRLDGFELALSSDYRTDSVTRTGPNASIRAWIPAAGTFYPAFLVYDAQGDERIGVFLDGVHIGTAVADWNSNTERLFFLAEPRTFRGGETIELRALGADGMYRIVALLLLRSKPAPRPYSYDFSEVAAQPEETRTAITWITSWPAACTVEWAPEGGGTVSRVVETVAANNHRMILRDLAARKPYRFRVSGATREGETVVTAWQPFVTRGHPPAKGTVTQGRVPLVAKDEVGTTASETIPVTSGLPFPKGELGSDAHVRLRDANGRERALQTRTLSRWEDGSAKWVLLDFQTGGPKDGAFVLEYGTSVRRRDAGTGLIVRESPDAVTIVTGPAKIVFGKNRPGLPEAYWLDLNRDGGFDESEQMISPRQPGAFHLTAEDGRVYTSLSPPDEVIVDEAGPLRAVVRVRGSHRDPEGRKLFSYILRVHAYAGKACLRVQHTFINDFPDSEFTAIRGLSFRLPLARKGGSWVKGAMGESSSAFRGEGRVHLEQHTDSRYVVHANGADNRSGGRAGGWAQWSDGVRTATLSVRDFWQNYPKDLVVDEAGLELGICPALRPDEYDAAKGTTDEHRLYYYLQSGVYKFRQGVSKTHDIWLDFQPAGRPDDAGAERSLVRTLRAPLLATPPPAWYLGSRAFGTISPVGGTGVSALYETVFARSFQGYLLNRETNREYGMLNFGDWWGERVVDWGNSEYDTQYGFLLQFARTGDLRYFRTAEEAELHNRDVDTAHAHRDPSRVGGVYVHCVGHTGDYYQQSPHPRGIVRGSFQISHTFIEGHLLYYFLTGDSRSLETSMKIADRGDLYQTRNYDFSDSRNAGWHLILTMAAYQATQDRFYLNAAKIIVERVLERQTPDGGWSKLLTGGHCSCLPRHHGNAGFMLAVLLTGLRRYEEATGDTRIAPAIIGGARFLIDDTWVPQARAFRYTSCPKKDVMPVLNFLSFDAIVYAHERTGDPRMKTVLIQGTDTALEAMRSIGKEFTQTTRVVPHFLSYLDHIREAPSGSAGP